MSCSTIGNFENCIPIKISRKGNYVKECYDLNNSYNFKIVLTDSCNENYDPETITVSAVYPSGQLIGPENPTKADIGFYYQEFTLDALGEWNIVWSVRKDGEVTNYSETILVENKNTITKVQKGLDFNSLIVIKLSKEIKDIEGFSLEEETLLSFSSEYNPFYCSVEMLRMEMGSWVDLVSDDTIALAIHWSSLEANNITGVRPTSERYYFARTRFVMFDAAIKLFSMPTGVSGEGSGKQKQLGDLLIESGNSLDFNLKDLVKELKAEREEWWRVVNAGGCIVPGQGLGPTSASKGINHSETVRKSREWHDPWQEHYIQPTQNSLYKKPGERKYKHGYSSWGQYHTGYGIRKRGI